MTTRKEETMSFQHSAAVALIAVTLVAVPVAAEEWQARFAANWTDTALSLRQVDEDGVALRFEGGDALGLSLGFERQIDVTLGLEFAIDFARPENQIGVTPPGAGEVSATARMDLWIVRAGLNLHPLPGHPVDLYLGPAVAWLHAPGSSTFSAEVGGHTSSLTIEADDGFGWGGTAGADVDLGGGWTLGVSYTYVAADLDFTDGTEGGERALDLNPSTLRLGVGVRF
jgi:opacity protein-like surface antigen